MPGTAHHTDGSGLEVAFFDHGRFEGTRRCRTARDARTFIESASAEPGKTCLIVSAVLRDSLLLSA